MVDGDGTYILSQTNHDFNHSENGTDHNHSGNLSPTISMWFRAIIFSALSFAFMIGTIGNILVCYIIAKRKKRRSIHYLTANLAISDLIVVVIYLPMQMYQIQSQLQWDLGRVTCRIIYLINSGTVNASIGTLLAITRDRYTAVMSPMQTRHRTSEVKKWIILIWALSFILTIPLIIVVDVVQISDENYCTETWSNAELERLYWIFIFFAQFVVPMAFITVSYIRILVTMKRSHIPTEMMAVYINNNNNNNNKYDLRASKRKLRRKRQQRKMLKMSITLVIVYAVCVLPQHTVFFAAVYGSLQSKAYGVYVFLTANFLMILNSAVNPVIYGTLNDEMNRGFQKLLTCNAYSGIFSSFRNSLQHIRLRRRAATARTNSTTSSTLLPDSPKKTFPKKTSVQFELCPITRIDNL